MRADPIEVEEYKGYVIKIYPDFDAQNLNPRENCTPLGEWWDWSREYRYGNVHFSPYDVDEVENEWKRLKREGAIVLFLWEGPYGELSCSAESTFPDGARGLAFLTKDRIREEYSCKRITKAIRARATGLLKAEIREYAEWVSGNVHGYIIEDPAVDEDGEIDIETEGKHVDSCWGFVGDPEYCMKEAKESADYFAEKRDKRRAEEAEEMAEAALY